MTDEKLLYFECTDTDGDNWVHEVKASKAYAVHAQIRQKFPELTIRIEKEWDMKKPKKELNGSLAAKDSDVELEVLLPKKSTVEISSAERKKLFASYADQTGKIEKLRGELEKLIAVRSTTVEQIVTQCGRGPFNYQGQLLSGVSRTNKESGNTIWFFKSPGKLEVIEV